MNGLPLSGFARGAALEVRAARRACMILALCAVVTLGAILALGAVLAGPAASQAPTAVQSIPAQSSPAPSALPQPLPIQPPPTQPPPTQPLDGYAEAAATTIIAEQSCPRIRLNAGALTTLRLAARVAPGQEAALEEKLRTRASQLRQQIAADGREAWCATAFAAYGPAGTAARGVLAEGPPGR